MVNSPTLIGFDKPRPYRSKRVSAFGDLAHFLSARATKSQPKTILLQNFFLPPKWSSQNIYKFRNPGNEISGAPTNLPMPFKAEQLLVTVHHIACAWYPLVPTSQVPVHSRKGKSSWNGAWLREYSDMRWSSALPLFICNPHGCTCSHGELC